VDGRWQEVDLGPLRDAQRDLLAAAQAYDRAAGATAELPPKRRDAVNRALREVAPSFMQASGLPQRPWYRHLLQAPGRKEGEDVAPLPAIGDAMDARAWDEAGREVEATAGATRRATSALVKAAKALSDGP
jgi:N-acetylated-alpha-linked acidic dipeptidase